MSEFVRVRRDGGVIELVLDRPEKKNALLAEMYLALAEALVSAELDSGVTTVIFTAEGGSFCAGNDIQDFLRRAPGVASESPVARFLHALTTSTKILIAAVEGRAVGIGVTLLLHCDLVAVAEDARLSFGFLKLALVPEAASSLLVPRLVGHRRAMELFLLREEISGPEAVEFAIANLATPAGATLETARGWAGRIGDLAPSAVRATKRLVTSDSSTVAARIDEEFASFAAQLASPHAREALAAFLQKRKPDFAACG